MLTISGLKKFYFVPDINDMRCGAHRLLEIVKHKHHLNTSNGDVFIFKWFRKKQNRDVGTWAESEIRWSEIIRWILLRIFTILTQDAEDMALSMNGAVGANKKKCSKA